jgi:hypothetical protein
MFWKDIKIEIMFRARLRRILKENIDKVYADHVRKEGLKQ